MTQTEDISINIINDTLAKRTAEIVCAYVSSNNQKITDLPGIIKDVSQALDQIYLGENGLRTTADHNQKPAVAIKKSIQDDYIICLEDGLRFISLKRHLTSKYEMTPEEYRSKWGLPHNYPMVAPDYSAKRSKIAKTVGLGRKAKSKS